MLKNKELLIGICLVIFLSVFIGQAQATKTQDKDREKNNLELFFRI